MIPSTLKEIEKGRWYSVVVALSTGAPRGKINAVVAEGACADAAGNLLQRTNRSSSVIRFGSCPSYSLHFTHRVSQLCAPDEKHVRPNVGLMTEEFCMSDRTIPSVNLWTAIPSCEVVIGNQPRTCEATNRASDLRIYLDFDTAVSSSAEDLLRLLSVTNGVLTPTGRKSLGNRRFGFRVSSIR